MRRGAESIHQPNRGSRAFTDKQRKLIFPRCRMCFDHPKVLVRKPRAHYLENAAQVLIFFSKGIPLKADNQKVNGDRDG